MQKKQFLILTILLALVSILRAQPQQQITPYINTLLNQYYDAVERADTTRALDALNKLITEDPQFPYYYSARASVLIALGKTPVESILADYQHALDMSPDDIQIIHQRAEYTAQFPSDKMQIISLNDYLVLVELDSMNFSNYKACKSYVFTKDSAFVKAFLEQAVSKMYYKVSAFPDDAEYWYQLGMACSWKASYTHANEDILLATGFLSEAIELDTTKSQYFIARAALYQQQSEHINDAIADYKSAMLLSSRAEWFLALGDLYKQFGDKTRALQQYNEGLKYYTNNYLLARAKKNINK